MRLPQVHRSCPLKDSVEVRLLRQIFNYLKTLAESEQTHSRVRHSLLTLASGFEAVVGWTAKKYGANMPAPTPVL